MEKPIYPSPYMRITQGYGEGTHVDSFAIDEENNLSYDVYKYLVDRLFLK